MPWNGTTKPPAGGRSPSAIFREWLSAALEPRTGFNGAWAGTNVFKAALYNDNITPDERVPAAQTAYDAGVWDVANEEVSPVLPPASQSFWPAGGLVVEETGSLGTPPDTGFESAGIMITFRGLPTGTGTELVSLDNVFGDLLYDTTAPAAVTPGTPQDVGAAFHYFGGIQTVTNGTFTIVWSQDGIMRVGVAIPP
jgi:hypothetical protein